MPKAKFKIGTLVKVAIPHPEKEETSHYAYGEVTVVMTNKQGHSYRVEGFDTDFLENSIVSAYRPVVTRSTKKSSSPRVKTGVTKITEQ